VLYVSRFACANQCSTKSPGWGDAGAGGRIGGTCGSTPQILGILEKWGTGERHIYNIKNIKYKILKIKIRMIKSQQ
jgi:hypothetical protein